MTGKATNVEAETMADCFCSGPPQLSFLFQQHIAMAFVSHCVIRSIKKGAMQSTDRVEIQMQTMLKLAAWLHCWLGLSRVTPSARASSSPSGICHYSALCIVQCAFCPVWLQFSFQTKSKFLNIFSKTVHLGCSPGPPRPFHPLLTKAASSE